MLGILWLTLWITLGEAYYDDYYTQEDEGINGFRIDWQRYIHDNFSDILRSFADVNGRDEEEMTIAIAKSKLRTLKIFEYTGSSSDFDSQKGTMLPLDEGAKYCTMGRHTKVDCNHCTCVAGQLYMCTGMICPEPRYDTTKPPLLSTCKEGKQRQIDSCNYCYCRNGREFCTTKDCWHNHQSLRETERCEEGSRHRVECNRCLCRNGEEYCTNKTCSGNDPNKEIQTLTWWGNQCRSGDSYYLDCKRCQCIRRRWLCSRTSCDKRLRQHLFMRTCKEGSERKLDSCNYCFCRNGKEFCENKDCGNEGRQILNVRNGISCSDGDQYKIDACNYCYCFNGQEYCTHKSCGDIEEELFYLPSCEEGNLRKIDSCNYCLCQGGEEVCTDEPCEDTDVVVSRKRKALDKCKSGKIKYVDCNVCACYGQGWACTKKACGWDLRKGEDKSLRKRRPKTCERWDVRYENCKQCECYDNRWVCREAICDEPHSKARQKDLYLEESCKKGDKRKLDSCNKCYCRYNQWFCENKQCEVMENSNNEHPSFIDLQPLHAERQACGKRTKLRLDACNYCYCDNGQWSCENKDCDNIMNGGNTEKKGLSLDNLPYTFVKRTELVECKIGSRLRVNACNYCYCNFERKLVCSKHKCIDINSNLHLQEASCKKGTQRQLDACNYCICYNGKEYCTQKSCWNTQPEPPCHPGVPLPAPDLCNECICLNSEVVCTIKLCIKEISGYLRNRGRNRIDTGECQIGRRRRRDTCNYCWCSFERKWMCSNHTCEFNFGRTWSTDTCVEGIRRQIDSCNYCICHEGLEFCTQKACMQYRQEPKKLHKPPQCFPGQDLPAPDACNRCICYRGEIICTQMICRHIRKRTITGKMCSEGTRRQIDACNYCICNGGLEYCTEKFCWSNSQKPKELLDPNCLPGQNIPAPDSCNKCMCYRAEILCTKMLCAQRTSDSLSNDTCVEGRRRLIDPCNYCLCNGGQEFCTQRSCTSFLQPSANVMKEPQCVPGQALPALDSCNKCMCFNSEIICTKQLCVGRKSGKIDDTCVEGEKYSLNDGCNYCVCRGGQEFCTSRACLIPDKYQTEKNTSCQEGEVTPSRDGCNVCVCIHGKATCTNNECPSIERQGTKNPYSSLRARNEKRPRFRKLKEIEETCSPGKSYVPKNDDPNCPNDCICDKNELLCTNRKCDKKGEVGALGTWLAKTVQIRQTKQLLKHEVCVENQPLPSEDPCNSCICLNERKVCTIIACSEKEDPIYVSGETGPGNKGNRGKNKGNWEKKKNSTFCTPFTFFSPDNNRFCRNCFCLHNGLALCLLNLCKYSKDIPHNPPLQQLQEFCMPGEIGYPTKCVTCTCSNQGTWMCTREELALCQERDCDAKDEFQMGFSSFCAGCKCSVKEWYCAIQHNMCQDYSNAKCPIGTFIHNPRQHCSICLCGGYHEDSQNMCFTEAKCVRQVTNQMKA